MKPYLNISTKKDARQELLLQNREAEPTRLIASVPCATRILSYDERKIMPASSFLAWVIRIVKQPFGCQLLSNKWKLILPPVLRYFLLCTFTLLTVLGNNTSVISSYFDTTFVINGNIRWTFDKIFKKLNY